MRRTPRFLVVAIPVLVGAAILWSRPAGKPAPHVPHPTVEPTLPLVIDLHAAADAANPASLQADLRAAADMDEVTLELVLPEGIDGDPGDLRPGRSTSMKANEARSYVVPLRARRDGDYPIRLLASFRLRDGRQFHTEQGMMWRSGPPRAEGVHHAGAYEVMGVPVAEPQP